MIPRKHALSEFILNPLLKMVELQPIFCNFLIHFAHVQGRHTVHQKLRQVEHIGQPENFEKLTLA